MAQNNIMETLANMTESEKDAHVEGVEFVLDWNGELEQEDFLLYKAIIAERQ